MGAVGVGGGEELGEDLGVGSPQKLGSVLEEVAHADGGDEHRQGGSLPQGLVGQALDDHAQHGAHQHGQQHPHQGRQAVGGRGEEAYVGAHHDDVAVGKVQHLGDAVDHSVAQGDDGIDASQAHAVDQMVQKAQITTPQFSPGAYRKRSGENGPFPINPNNKKEAGCRSRQPAVASFLLDHTVPVPRLLPFGAPAKAVLRFRGETTSSGAAALSGSARKQRMRSLRGVSPCPRKRRSR